MDKVVIISTGGTISASRNAQVLRTAKSFKFSQWELRPSKASNDGEALWSGLERGVVNTVASDHVARPLHLKSEGDLCNKWTGCPSTPMLLPALWFVSLQR